jgi:nitric oxide reductase subunit B
LRGRLPTATTDRLGYTYSYTNNWPPEALAGNFITADAIPWSVISIIGLLAGTGLILFSFGRYDWLGLERRGNQASAVSSDR